MTFLKWIVSTVGGSSGPEMDAYIVKALILIINPVCTVTYSRVYCLMPFSNLWVLLLFSFRFCDYFISVVYEEKLLISY